VECTPFGNRRGLARGKYKKGDKFTDKKEWGILKKRVKLCGMRAKGRDQIKGLPAERTSELEGKGGDKGSGVVLVEKG